MKSDRKFTLISIGIGVLAGVAVLAKVPSIPAALIVSVSAALATVWVACLDYRDDRIKTFGR